MIVFENSQFKQRLTCYSTIQLFNKLDNSLLAETDTLRLPTMEQLIIEAQQQRIEYNIEE
jgi:hypothetical protein